MRGNIAGDEPNTRKYSNIIDHLEIDTFNVYNYVSERMSLVQATVFRPPDQRLCYDTVEIDYSTPVKTVKIFVTRNITEHCC